MSIARHHSEWLSLVEVSGPFLSMPVLMRVFPQGLDAHDPERFRTLRLAYEEWEDNNEAGPRTNPALHGAWIRFVLTNVLGLPDEAILEQQAIPQTLQASVPEHGEFLRPSLVIAEPGTAKPRLLVQTYPASQDLDKPVSGKTWKASPGTRMMELLHDTGVRLGLVTNGERWMLVDAPKNETTGFASWYASLWLEEPITLRAFTSLLGTERFFNAPEADTLEAMLAESASNQQEVTDQLGYQVRRAVEVLIQSLDRADQDHDRSLLGTIPEPQLYEAALTVMMRLVFLFSAEERGLLLLSDELYARNYALSTLREQLRKTADDHGEEILERRHDAWCRLLSTFRAVYGGVKHDRMTLPAYGGHLFDPDRFPFLEGRKAGTTWKTCEADPLPVNNRTILHLLEALQMLEVKMPGGEKAARRVSFRALDIEQIGHVYEGLLDHTAKRATEPMLGLFGTRDREPEVPLSKLEELVAKGEDKLVEFLREETGKSASALRNALAEKIDLHNANRLQAVCGSDKALLKRIAPFAGLLREDTFGYPVVITKGSVFVTAGTDRRSSGTHYTPRSLTEPIVQHTLEPLVYVGPTDGKPKEEWRLRPAKELLDLKICDCACGSGAFLVQACRYLSERLVEAWEVIEKNNPSPNPSKLPFPTITPEGTPATGKPGEALIPKEATGRLAYARRIVAQRCLYGVDINPLAAEMAKLSLWLLTLAKDKPFTFLDHAIRPGDTLFGINDLRQLKHFSLNVKEQREWQFDEMSLNEVVDRSSQLRRQLESLPADSVEDIAWQERLLAEGRTLTLSLQAAADLMLSAEAKYDSRDERADRLDLAAIRYGQMLKSEGPERTSQLALNELGRPRFHWPLEFPEVFVGRSGFDAFVGNPPFMGGKKISGQYGAEYRQYLVDHVAHSKRGNADLCAYFFLRARGLLRWDGVAGLVATNTISQGDTREVGLDVLTRDQTTVIRAVSNRRWPGTANVVVSNVWMKAGDWHGRRVLDDVEVKGVTALLTPVGEVFGTPHELAESRGRAFIGSYVLGTGFTLSVDQASRLIDKDRSNGMVLFPYLNGEDINTSPSQSATRWIINFFDWPLSRATAPDAYTGPVAEDFPDCLQVVIENVKPERDALGTKSDSSAKGYAKFWWHYARKGIELYKSISEKSHVLVKARISPVHAIVRVPTGKVFNEKTVVFMGEMEHFAVLQSSIHEAWAVEYSPTMGQTTISYSPSACFETFPVPELLRPDTAARPTVDGLVQAGSSYHEDRARIMERDSIGLTLLYNRFHSADNQAGDIGRLRESHVRMDAAVAAEYGWSDVRLDHGFHKTKQGNRFTISPVARREVLARLLKLNHQRYAGEVAQGLHDKKKASGARKTRGKVTAKEDANLFG